MGFPAGAEPGLFRPILLLGNQSFLKSRPRRRIVRLTVSGVTATPRLINSTVKARNDRSPFSTRRPRSYSSCTPVIEGRRRPPRLPGSRLLPVCCFCPSRTAVAIETPTVPLRTGRSQLLITLPLCRSALLYEFGRPNSKHLSPIIRSTRPSAPQVGGVALRPGRSS